MTDTCSLELVSIVTVKDDFRGRDKKTTSHDGADGDEDVQTMEVDTTIGLYFPARHEAQ